MVGWCVRARGEEEAVRGVRRRREREKSGWRRALKGLIPQVSSQYGADPGCGRTWASRTQVVASCLTDH